MERTRGDGRAEGAGMRVATRYVLGIDVGSQGMKTVLLDASGTIAASAYATYDPHYPAPNWAEERPAAWETALVTTIQQVMHQAGAQPEDVVAMAMISQVEGLACGETR